MAPELETENFDYRTFQKDGRVCDPDVTLKSIQKGIAASLNVIALLNIFERACKVKATNTLMKEVMKSDSKPSTQGNQRRSQPQNGGPSRN